MAAGLLAGYGWLALTGVLWLQAGLVPGRFVYDAAVHALFLGFVMSMVFAHAPVLVPSLTGLDFPFRRSLWVPLGLLHGSLVMRMAGDLLTWLPGRRWGRLLNVIAMGLLVVTAAFTIIQSRRRSGSRSPSSSSAVGATRR